MIRGQGGQVKGRLDRPDTPVAARCEVVLRRREGAYWLLTLAAPEIARRARPGQFVSLAVGAPATLLRRPFSIAQVTRRGAVAGTVDVVFDEHGPGTTWLTRLQLHDVIDVLGPLGTPFPLPQRKVSCLLVGGGYGVAPLFFLARELTDRGQRVDMLVGAASVDRLHDTIETKSLSVTATFTTEDGSYGEKGRVTDILDDVIDRCGAGVVYACGPNAMLAAVSAICQRRGLPVQVAVEERMACGTGVCFTCVMPVRDRDGSVQHRRSCLDGPVFNGALIDWSATRFAAVSNRHEPALADEEWTEPASPGSPAEADSLPPVGPPGRQPGVGSRTQSDQWPDMGEAAGPETKGDERHAAPGSRPRRRGVLGRYANPTSDRSSPSVRADDGDDEHRPGSTS